MQISVAHVCERPAEIFVQNAQSHPLATSEVAYSPVFIRSWFSLSQTPPLGVTTHHFRNPPARYWVGPLWSVLPPIASTALALGWGSLGANPLKDPTYGGTQVSPCT